MTLPVSGPVAYIRAMNGSRTGGRILVDALIAQGCDRVFTVPGESFLAVLDALHDTPAIDLIVARQEGGVAYMAEADGSIPSPSTKSPASLAGLVTAPG